MYESSENCEGWYETKTVLHDIPRKYSDSCIEISKTIATTAYMNQVKTVKVDKYGVTAPKTVPEGTVHWLPIEIELLMDGLWTPELHLSDELLTTIEDI